MWTLVVVVGPLTMVPYFLLGNHFDDQDISSFLWGVRSTRVNVGSECQVLLVVVLFLEWVFLLGNPA